MILEAKGTVGGASASWKVAGTAAVGALERRGKSRILVLFVFCMVTFQFPLLRIMLAVGFSLDALCWVKEVHYSVSGLSCNFVMKDYRILSNAFPIPIELIVYCLTFMLI